MAVIDVWMQHPTRRFLQLPCFESLLRWTGRDAIADVPLEFTMAAMNQADVSLGLIAAWHGPQGALISNDEVAGWVAEHPDRLAGLASVDLFQPMQAVRELRRCVKKLGFRGLRMVPWLWGLPPDDRRYYPLYAACCEMDVPFCTQIGHTGPLLSSEPGRPIPYLENVALEFPELKIVAGHLGVPWIAEAISLALKFPNVYIDTSAYKLTRIPPEFVQFMRGPGRTKVLFGTNYPMLNAAQCLDGLAALQLEEQTRRAFLHDNAVRVFDLKEESAA